MWNISYRMFRAISALSYAIGRRLTPAGMLVLSAAVLAGALGVDTTLSVAHQAFGFLAALLGVAALCLPFLRAPLTVERELPRVATAGEPFTYRVRVRNAGSSPMDGISLTEDLPDPWPSLEAFRAAAALPHYRAWQRVLEAERMVRVAERAVPALAAGAAVEVDMEARALRRGVLHSRGVTIACAEPLGLLKTLRAMAQRANLVVLPRRYPLPPFTLPGSRRYQQGGVALAMSVGDSEEFIGLRDYRPGDPLQRIHWKSFARTARPIVREYQDEYFERYALVLDTFAARGMERSFEEAVSIAASFACTIDTRECLLDLMFIGAEAYSYTTGRGQLPAGGLLEILAGVQPCHGRRFPTLREAVLVRRHALSGCICVLLGWDDERQAFARALREQGVDLRVIAVGEAPIADPPAWLVAVAPGSIGQGLTACRAWA